MKIGIRGHDTLTNDELSLIKELHTLHVDNVQLALQKSFGNLDYLNSNDFIRLNTLFNGYQVNVPILGCYINMVAPDITLRNKEINKFKKHIELASYLNSSYIASETGSLSKDGYTTSNFTKEAYNTTLKSIKQLVNHTSNYDVKVAIEGGINHPLYTIELVKQLVDDINNDDLVIIFDLYNFLTLDNYLKQERMIDYFFDNLKEHVKILHLKDFNIRNNKLEQVALGEGLMKLDYLITKFLTYNNDILCIIENQQGNDLLRSINYLKNYKL